MTASASNSDSPSHPLGQAPLGAPPLSHLAQVGSHRHVQALCKAGQEWVVPGCLEQSPRRDTHKMTVENKALPHMPPPPGEALHAPAASDPKYSAS
jgi:hypothetical protein